MENKPAVYGNALKAVEGIQEKKEVLVQICTGTSCFIMGGADLLLLEEVLPTRLRSSVRVEGVPCTGQCRAAGQLWAQRPPFLTIDGKPYSGLNLPQVIEIIQKLIEPAAAMDSASEIRSGNESGENREAFSC